MATSKKSTGKKSKDPTLFVVAIHASRSAQQANEKAKKIRVTSGLGFEKPLANYDPDTQSWKMFGDISLWGDCPLLANLPPSGMTRSGVLFLQPAWEPITGETELLSWPTPMASDWKPRGPNSKQKGLAEVVKMWPTPTAHPDNSNINGKFQNPTLGDAVRMWPTPRASASMSEDIATVRAQLEDGKPYKARLEEAVSKYPTPTHGSMSGGTGAFNKAQQLYSEGLITDEERKAIQAGNGGKLNPTWVEWLMGFPLGWTDLEALGTP